MIEPNRKCEPWVVAPASRRRFFCSSYFTKTPGSPGKTASRKACTLRNHESKSVAFLASVMNHVGRTADALWLSEAGCFSNS